jgi:hypothetical protein
METDWQGSYSIGEWRPCIDCADTPGDPGERRYRPVRPISDLGADPILPRPLVI